MRVQIRRTLRPYEFQDYYPATTANQFVDEMACEHGLMSLALAEELGTVDGLYLMSDDTIGVEVTIADQTFFWRGERTGWDEPGDVLEAISSAVLHQDLTVEGGS